MSKSAVLPRYGLRRLELPKPTAHDNAAMFDAYEQEYKDKSYTLFTDDLNTEYRLFSQLQSEYDTVAAYTDFLEACRPRRRNCPASRSFKTTTPGTI